MRVTAALMRIFGGISDTPALMTAVVAPLTLRDGLLPSTHKQQRRQKSRLYFFGFPQFSAMKHPLLENRTFRRNETPKYFPENRRPSTLSRFKQQS